MKALVFISISLVIVGCAQTMTISEEKLGSSTASLTVDASSLEGYVSMPLINHKSVNVSLSEFPDCIDGEAQKKRSQALGRATLTPKENLQTIVIPSGRKLLVSSNSEENWGGNIYTCWNAVHFTPEEGHSYTLKVVPHQSFGSEQCMTKLIELIDGESTAVESAVYPKVEYKGFWKGNEFNHCQSDTEESAGPES